MTDPDVLPDKLHPVLRRIYAARGVAKAEDLETGLTKMLPPTGLKGLNQAVDLLEQAVREGWGVVIVGDFDADGATSSALAMYALTQMGVAKVNYVVPNRFAFGYGLTPELMEVVSTYDPKLLITVDNGISSIDGVAAAQAAGYKVLVTDHHLPGASLPAADAIVNPNQAGDEFPSKNLAGVGVIFYVMTALRSRLRDTGWFEETGRAEPNMGHFLDLVALGTVADVVPLDHNNRVLVDQGLKRIRAKCTRPGIRALIQLAKRRIDDLQASDLGFAIGPRLNAAGRLEDMSVGIECLLTMDEEAAMTLAQQLDELNRDRREIERQMQQEANAAMDRLTVGTDRQSKLPWGLALYEEGWHQGVIGILASRLKEKFNRPVLAFAPADDGSGTHVDQGQIKGSTRSVPGLHIRDVLEAISTAHPGMITKFGGHAMAAGLTMPEEHFKAFSEAFDGEVRRRLTEQDLQGVVQSDGELDSADISLPLAETLRSAGPWGQAFPEPVFDGWFRLDQRRVVGQKHLKINVTPWIAGAPQGHALDGIAFNFPVEEALPAPGTIIHLAYRLDVNEFRGMRSAQLIVEELQPV